MTESYGSLAEQTGVDDEERRNRVNEIVNEIEGRGLTSVRLAFADAHGLLRGKAIRADLVAEAFANGVGITSALLMKDTGQNNVYPVWAPGGGLDKPWLTGAGDIMMLPDPATFRVLPWAAKTGWLLCDVFSPDGAAVGFSTRRLCAVAEQDLIATGVGFKAGLEMEFHLYHTATNSGAGTGGHGAASGTTNGPAGKSSQHLTPIHPGWMYLGENRFDSIEPILEIFRSNLAELGVPPRSLEVELGPGQVELTFSPDSALVVADHAVLIRSAVKQIARRHGLIATFMSRPHLSGSFTSGWHLHQSLVDLDTDRNLFAVRADANQTLGNQTLGNQTLGNQTLGNRILGETGQHYLAGLLTHAAASCLLTTPTVTGYKRYRPESLAPSRASWATQNRGAMLRVIGQPGDPATRIENRVGDPAANPYLYVASQIVGGSEGLRGRQGPPPSADSPYVQEAGPRLPTNLGDAIEIFNRSDLFRSAFGSEFVDYLVGIKTAEWDRFLATVTDWEHHEYAELF